MPWRVRGVEVELLRGGVAGGVGVDAAGSKAARDAVGSAAGVCCGEDGVGGSSSMAVALSPSDVLGEGTDTWPCDWGKHKRAARASSRLRPRAYAELSREDQPPPCFWPPTWVALVECVQRRAPRCEKELAGELVQERVVNF
eukprot:1368839-Pleurochrysis_carterae.AAC.11